MFGKLKEKLKEWTKKISEKKESKEEIELPITFDTLKQKKEPDFEEIEKTKEIAKIKKAPYQKLMREWIDRGIRQEVKSST